MNEKYRGFCRESKCVQYINIQRLESELKFSGVSSIKYKIDMLNKECEQRCRAHHFYDWLIKTNLI